MPLISKINFFHVHNPRCGGTSINSALYHSDLTNLKYLSYNQCDMENFYGVYRPKGANKVSHEPKILELDHLSISQVLTRLGLEKIRTLHFISSVRDPWSRFVSEYKRKRQRNDKRFLDVGDSSLAQYLERFLQHVSDTPDCFTNHFQSAHFWPQHWFADFNAHPDIHSYSIIKLENFNSDWKSLQEKWNFSAPLRSKDSNATRQEQSQPKQDEHKEIKSSSLFNEFKNYYQRDYDLFGYWIRATQHSPTKPTINQVKYLSKKENLYAISTPFLVSSMEQIPDKPYLPVTRPRKSPRKKL